MTVTYKPSGVCAQQMTINAKDGIITEVEILGGCDGNKQAVCRLIADMKIEDAIARLSGISCNTKSSSCPDQLSIALKMLLDS